jgi:hypothetical protein
MNPYVIAAAATIGGFMGLQAASKRNDEAFMATLREDTLWNLRKKQLGRGGELARGNLSMSALGASANNREAAMAANQQNSAGLAKVGVSGTIGGTAFYKLDQDIRDNATRLREQEAMSRGSVEKAVLAVQDQKDSGLIEEQQHIYRADDLAAEEEYTGSLWAAVMGAVTGAASGVSTAMGVEKGLFDMGFLSEPKSDVVDPKAFDAFPLATPGGLQEDASSLAAPPPGFQEDAYPLAVPPPDFGSIVNMGSVFSFQGDTPSSSWVPGSSLAVPGFDTGAAPIVPFDSGKAPMFNMQNDLFAQSIDDWLSNRRPLFRNDGGKGRGTFGRVR